MYHYHAEVILEETEASHNNLVNYEIIVLYLVLIAGLIDVGFNNY